jgi:trehalose/maltose hydrolase-like predicted phosphorylase
VSKAQYNSTGVAHVLNVIPPDEYAQGDDSVFTNYVAKISLEFATEAANLLGITPDPAWASLAQSIVMLYDADLDLHPEYAQYQQGQAIKQADVVPLFLSLSRVSNT